MKKSLLITVSRYSGLISFHCFLFLVYFDVFIFNADRRKKDSYNWINSSFNKDKLEVDGTDENDGL